MTLNPFFNKDRRSSEQELLENLIIESIQTYGFEMYYLPRRGKNYDYLSGDDDQSYYDTAIPVEMYIKSVDGFGGDRIFMSKFDIEVRDQIIFTIARRRFEQNIGHPENFIAPREQDLIYFPMNKKLFMVMFAENKPFFYQLGSLQMFDMTCENFEYTSQKFSTGIVDIDKFELDHSQDIANTATEGIDSINLDDSDEIQAEQGNTLLDFSETNPYAEGNY